MKKAISLILALVMCLSLCACGCTCDCPYCCEGSEGNTPETTVPETTVPETTKSQKEVLTELLVSTTWTWAHKSHEFTFFDDGTGFLAGTDDNGLSFSSSFKWEIKGDRLVYTFNFGQSTYVFNYIEEEGIFQNSDGKQIIPKK